MGEISLGRNKFWEKGNLKYILINFMEKSIVKVVSLKKFRVGKKKVRFNYIMYLVII